MITAGMLLPAGTAVAPEQIFVEDYKSIQSYVGGAFDAVRTDLGHEGVALVGYVHDEGMLIPLEYNYIATALFKQDIYGDCVLVWGLDEQGIYDGDNHDIPDFMVEFLSEELMSSVRKSYDASAGIAIALDYAVEFGLVEEEEVDMLLLVMQDSLETGDTPRECIVRLNEILNLVLAHSAENESSVDAWLTKNTITDTEEG